MKYVKNTHTHTHRILQALSRHYVSKHFISLKPQRFELPNDLLLLNGDETLRNSLHAIFM